MCRKCFHCINIWLTWVEFLNQEKVFCFNRLQTWTGNSMRFFSVCKLKTSTTMRMHCTQTHRINWFYCLCSVLKHISNTKGNRMFQHSSKARVYVRDEIVFIARQISTVLTTANRWKMYRLASNNHRYNIKRTSKRNQITPRPCKIFLRDKGLKILQAFCLKACRRPNILEKPVNFAFFVRRPTHLFSSMWPYCCLFKLAISCAHCKATSFICVANTSSNLRHCQQK